MTVCDSVLQCGDNIAGSSLMTRHQHVNGTSLFFIHPELPTILVCIMKSALREAAECLAVSLVNKPAVPVVITVVSLNYTAALAAMFFGFCACCNVMLPPTILLWDTN